MTNLRWRFCKVLWPSQNIWTLWTTSVVHGLGQTDVSYETICLSLTCLYDVISAISPLLLERVWRTKTSKIQMSVDTAWSILKYKHCWIIFRIILYTGCLICIWTILWGFLEVIGWLFNIKDFNASKKPLKVNKVYFLWQQAWPHNDPLIFFFKK